jgi:hypothetical protein
MINTPIIVDSKQMQNIFKAHTPFHAYISEMIVGKMDEFTNCKNVLLLEFYQRFEHINSKLWSEVIFLEYVGHSTLGRERYLKCENNMRIVRKLVEGNKKSCLFLSDIASPMNNRLFFDRQLQKKAAFCLFSDGLGTYLFPKVTKMLFLRGLVKHLNGLLGGGVRYRNYLGSQFGVDRQKIKYIYAPNVSFVKCDLLKKKEILTMPMKKPYFNQAICIFLETNGWLVINEKDWNIIRSKTVNFLKSLGVNIYYKNHPFGRKEEELYYQNQGFSIIKDNRCAEQVIDEEGFDIAVSYVSSTLFNLKSLYQDSIRCIALSNKMVKSNTDYNENKSDEVYELFRKVNVEVVEV